jgi:hypothetical protein
MRTSVLAALALACFVACGPSSKAGGVDGNPGCPGVDLQNDPMNCGACNNRCDSTQMCSAGSCQAEHCNPGDARACYDGPAGTEGVGPCMGGNQSCNSGGTWDACSGEVLPKGEVCGNHIDDNCNGMVDEDVDADGDGFTTCGGDCCDSPSDGCGDNPALVNPGAYEVVGNTIDDDCDGKVDEATPACDSGLKSNTTTAMDYAKAIDICQTATASDKNWGVISAGWTFADGTGAPNAEGRSIRPKFGTGLPPKMGSALALISTGIAAGRGDTNPNYAGDNTISTPHNTDILNGETAGFPTDFINAHSGTLPNAPGCPAPTGTDSHDSEMLTLKIRVPTNAKSFSMNVNFYSYEFPEYTCSPFNDFFVVLLDSAYTGSPANPADKNLAFYQSGANQYPVGVNLASGNTGLFTECKNGATGCAGAGPAGSINTCKDVLELAGTGFDVADNLDCQSGSTAGGGTGWLTTSGNVKPGEIMTLRIGIWDTSDAQYDSTAVIDNFQWSVTASNPGTVIN